MAHCYFMKFKLDDWLKAGGFALMVAVSTVVLAQVPSQPGRAPMVVIAKVGDTVITQDEYSAAFNAATRSKFYHGKPPENEVAKLQREVLDQMVARILLVREASRRNLRADAAEIQKQLQVYEQRYAGSEQWKKTRAQLLPPLQARLEQEDVLRQLELAVRSGVRATESQAKAYHAANPAKFTEPEQMRVAAILLKVDPSSTSATWKKAEEEAQALAKRVRAGEDFAVLARQHSADESAAQGGDMGYLHSGMLPDGAQDVLSKMKVNDISDPVRLLEGFAVFKLTGRKPAVVHGFDKVKVRAQELAQRDLSEAAWTAFVADLKSKTLIEIDQSRLLPLAK